MRTVLLTALMTLAPAAYAQSYGGGGIVFQQGSLNWDVPGQRTTNLVGCVGGIGYGVTDGKRKGGEGHYCSGPYANMAMGGVHFGWQSKQAGMWLMAYNTVGAGWVGVHGEDEGRFDGVFAYTRPTLGGGGAIGSWAAIEGGAYLMLPVNLVGVVSSEMDAQVAFPHVGLQATVLFGDFTRKRRRGPKGTPQAAEPLAIPGATPPPPRTEPAPRPRPTPPPPPPTNDGPLRPGDLPPAEREKPDEPPLAIPNR